MSSSREVPTLRTTALKAIARQPGHCLREDLVLRALSRMPPADAHARSRVTSQVVHYVTDAGRFTDEMIPVCIFDPAADVIDVTNSKVSDGYLRQIVDRCPGARAINVAGCFQVDDDVVKYVLTKCPKVHKLNLQNCRKLTDRALEEVARSGCQIDRLDVGGDFNITEAGLVHFLKTYRHAGAMKELNVSGLRVTQTGLTAIVDRCTGLDCLGIGYANVDEESVRLVVNTMGPRLKHLNISWLPCGEDPEAFSSDFFSLLLGRCPHLIDLDICGLKAVTAATLQMYLDSKNAQVYIFQCLSCYDLHTITVSKCIPLYVYIYTLTMLCHQHEENPTKVRALHTLRAKFIAPSRQQVETLLSGYQHLKYEA